MKTQPYECPGPECPSCSGEHCDIHLSEPCDCDVVKRHASDYSSGGTMTNDVRHVVERLRGHAKACRQHEPYKADERASDLERAADALDALTSQPAPSGWQPIESAPKDGTPVIGFDPVRESEWPLMQGVEFMRWLHGMWLDPATHMMRPTHWMPLPPAPWQNAKDALPPSSACALKTVRGNR